MMWLRLAWYSLIPLWLLMLLGFVLNHFWPPYWIILTIIAGIAFVVYTIIEEVRDYRKYAKLLDTRARRAWYALGNILMCVASPFIPLMLFIPNIDGIPLFMIFCIIMIGVVLACIKAER